MPASTPPLARGALARRSVLVAGVALLSGCSLRWEKDAPLPGPKATTPSDVAPLQHLRSQLVTVIDTADGSADHPEQAIAITRLHRTQLTRLDATLKGLGAAPPSPRAHPSGKGGTWPTAEVAWANESNANLFASMGPESRPMAMSIASCGLAAAESAGKTAKWSAQASFPQGGSETALTAIEATIDAFEWVGAHTDAKSRGSIPQALEWLYGVRAMVEAAANAPKTSTPAPFRRYPNLAEAKKVAATGLEDLLSACGTAAARATSAHDVAGVLLTWSKTIRELQRQGTPSSSPFPGLASN